MEFHLITGKEHQVDLGFSCAQFGDIFSLENQRTPSYPVTIVRSRTPSPGPCDFYSAIYLSPSSGWRCCPCNDWNVSAGEQLVQTSFW